MLDNDNNSVESDVDSQAPSEPIQETKQAESQSHPQAEKYVPYDRFQEVIQQKNELLKRFEDSDKRFNELQQQFKSSQKPAETAASREQQLINRLKSIDPDFGSWAESQEALKKDLEDMRGWRSQFERERVQGTAKSTLEQLHTEYKVPKELQDRYTKLIKAEAVDNPQLGLKDLPALYKQIHEDYTKAQEDFKRSILAEYGKQKASDSNVPTSNKGTTPKSDSKPKFSADPDEAKAQIIKRAIEAHRQAKNA